jgi:hypothetical protein
MTPDEEQWFLDGHLWTLKLLRLSGVEIDDPRVKQTLIQLREGQLSSMNSLSERIADIEHMSEEFGVTYSIMELDELKQKIREIDPIQRRGAMEHDKASASLILDFQEGRWPKLNRG